MVFTWVQPTFSKWQTGYETSVLKEIGFVFRNWKQKPEMVEAASAFSLFIERGAE
jgi:hypothetical protein